MELNEVEECIMTKDEEENDDSCCWSKAEYIEEEEEDSPPTSKNSISKQPRYRRQKYCSQWEKEFSWLREDPENNAYGICITCNAKLICKKSHLTRHQNSFKHQRLSGGTTVSRISRGAQKVEIVTEFEELIDEDDHEAIEEREVSKTRTSTHNIRGTHHESCADDSPLTMSSKSNKSSKHLDRYKLLQRIHQERSILNDYYYTHQKQSKGGHTTVSSASKDTFDLFFQSVSESVKSLPPKLAAEMKMKVSKILTEYEIRAICEREALLNTAAAATDAVGEMETTFER